MGPEAYDALNFNERVRIPSHKAALEVSRPTFGWMTVMVSEADDALH